MPEPIAPAPAATRLRTMLEEARLGVGDELLAEARALGPHATADVVASVIEAELTHPDRFGPAIRAAHVAHELGLAGAIPVLEHGEWRAVGDRVSAADRLLRAPLDDRALCSGQHLRAIESAVRLLGGTLSEDQLRGIRDVLESAEASWTTPDDPFADPDLFHDTATHGRPPRRNDPCPCGSGKKYKKCHLGADERRARH